MQNLSKILNEIGPPPKNIDLFGFLKEPINLFFVGGKVLVCEEFEKATEWMEKYTNKDGFLYPPVSHQVKINPETGKTRKIPRSEKPASLFRLPPSHLLIMDEDGDQKKYRDGIGNFVINCLSYLYGTRLQFEDWWVEGRIPFDSTINTRVTEKIAETFLAKAIQTWKKENDRNKMVFSNLLYIHAKAGSVQWDWERFQLEYVVADACYRVAVRMKRCTETSHKERLFALASAFNIQKDDNLFKLFWRLRNDLFHEALWDEGQPNTVRSSASFFASFQLRRFNHRLINAILCGTSDYSSSNWKTMDPTLMKL